MPELHWIITLQWGASDRPASSTLAGTVEPQHGATRREIFQDIMEAAKESLGAPDNAVVLFFDLALNQPPA